MSIEENTDPPRIKVNRPRKRLYQATEPTEAESVEPASAAPAENDISLGPVRQKTNKEQANTIIKNYMLWSAGSALVPIPIVDMAGMMVIQLKLVKELCRVYGVPFSSQKSKPLIASLVAGVPAGMLASSLFKIIPFIGLGATILPLATISAGLTYAIGKVFVYHFETGGVLLDFDPDKMKNSFYRKFNEGQNVTTGIGGNKISNKKHRN